MKTLFKFKIVVKIFVFALLLVSVGSTSNVFAVTSKSVPKVSIKSIADISVKVNQGNIYTLPRTVTAKMSNGKIQKSVVTWNVKKVSTSKVGIHTFLGTVKGYSRKIKLNITVAAPMNNQEKVLLAQFKSQEIIAQKKLQYTKNEKAIIILGSGNLNPVADPEKIQLCQDQLDLIQAEIKVLLSCNAKSDYRKELLLVELKHDKVLAQRNLVFAKINRDVRMYINNSWEWVVDETEIYRYQNEINNIQSEIDYVQAELSDEK